MEEDDVQLQLKKRARRRLVGAAFFASVVALVLPMLMDHQPRQQVPDVEIRIPGQDDKPFAPRFAVAPVEQPAAVKKPEVQAPPPPVAEPAKPPVPPVAKPETQAAPTARVVETSRDKPSDKPADKPAEKPAAKPADKAPEKPAAKPEKPADKPAARDDGDAKRAAAILAGKPAEAAPAKGGEYLVLIGAFANEANVTNIKTKLGEQGIKTFSEPLDTPQGRKTRVRAGPFPSREAAEKALDKMRKIGVSGVVAAKQ
jgi:DedD protein